MPDIADHSHGLTCSLVWNEAEWRALAEWLFEARREGGRGISDSAPGLPPEFDGKEGK